tara:strand:+ start:454 stop:801 length:348 start_codon:yes stop_codon:yes gene_type:complete
MLKKIAVSLAVAGLMLAPTVPGQAFFELGKTLKIKCFDDVNSHDRAFCMGYILGIADVMMEGNTVNDFKACIPESAPEDKIWSTVTKFLKANPGNLHYTADDLVAFAFQETFPCK